MSPLVWCLHLTVQWRTQIHPIQAYGAFMHIYNGYSSKSYKWYQKAVFKLFQTGLHVLEFEWRFKLKRLKSIVASRIFPIQFIGIYANKLECEKHKRNQNG
jgi:hypothetical protein